MRKTHGRPGLEYRTAYDARGNIVFATVDGVSTNLYAYDVFGNLTNEVQNGTVIARDYDAFGRPTGYALGGFAPSREVHYAYDPFGRFVSVSAGGSGDVPRPLRTFAYTYLSGSDLVSGYTCGSFSRSVSYDPNRNLISAVTNAFNASTISTFEYANNAAGRRISRLDTFDGVVTTNLFGYNHRSEVTSAVMGTNTYGYAYDPIGNRIEASHNAETNAYAANSLNQYTSISNLRASAPPREPTYDTDGNMISDAYSPFGEQVVAVDLHPRAFSHRFSTKPWCMDTEINEYVYRKYRPDMGRWTSRDPIGESGGHNIYAMIDNDTVSKSDILGLYDDSSCRRKTKPCDCGDAELNAAALRAINAGIEEMHRANDGHERCGFLCCNRLTFSSNDLHWVRNKDYPFFGGIGGDTGRRLDPTDKPAPPGVIEPPRVPGNPIETVIPWEN